MSDNLSYNHRIVLMPRAYHHFLEKVIQVGTPAAPGGTPTLELLNSSVIVRDVVDRVIPDRGRRMNIAFGIAEWWAMMFACDDIWFFKKFIQDYDRFSSDGARLDGAYGTRVKYFVSMKEQHDQILGVIHELRRDPSSRRAVMAIYNSEDLFGMGGKNTPCTLSLQFLIRDEKLHLIVNMRSSDVVKGLTYDLFVFTMIQEYIARQLGVDTGTYFHNAGSLHFYESDRPMYAGLKGHSNVRWPRKMNAMPLLTFDDMKRFEEIIKLDIDGRSFYHKIVTWPDTESARYLKNLAYVMKCFVDRKSAPASSKTAFNCITDATLRYVLMPWTQKK